jgi:hypothetical protein
MMVNRTSLKKIIKKNEFYAVFPELSFVRFGIVKTSCCNSIKEEVYNSVKNHIMSNHSKWLKYLKVDRIDLIHNGRRHVFKSQL